MKRYVQLHFLVLLLAATALLGRGISLSSFGVVVWRTAFACLGAAIWTGVLRPMLAKKGGPRPAPLWPGAKQALKLMGIGAIIGPHWLCFFGAVKLSNVSVGLLALTTMSLFTAFTEPFFDKRRVRPFEVLLGVLIICGIGLAAGFETRYLPGLLVGLGAAFLAAVFPVLNRRVVQAGGDPQVMVAWEMLGACLVSLAVLPFFSNYHELLNWHGLDWLWLLALAWICTVFAHAFHIHLLRFFSAYTMNLAINFEPIYGVIAAALIFAEYKELTPAFYLGMSTALAANLLHPLIIRWQQRRKGIVLESDAA